MNRNEAAFIVGALAFTASMIAAITSAALPGTGPATSSAASEFSVSFWAGLYSGLICSVLVGVAVGMGLWRLQLHRDELRRRLEYEKDLELLKERVRSAAEYLDVVSFDHPVNTIPRSLRMVIRTTDDRPLHQWRQHVPKEVAFLDLLIEVRRSYRAFQVVADILDIKLYHAMESWMFPRRPSRRQSEAGITYFMLRISAQTEGGSLLFADRTERMHSWLRSFWRQAVRGSEVEALILEYQDARAETIVRLGQLRTYLGISCESRFMSELVQRSNPGDREDSTGSRTRQEASSAYALATTVP